MTVNVAVDHGAAPIVGYTDRFSARPGETVAVHASSTGASAAVGLVRLGHDGSGWTAVPEAGAVHPQRVSLRHESFPFGSHVEVDGVDLPADGWRVALWLWVTAYPAERAQLVSMGDGLSVELDSAGYVSFGDARSDRPLDRYRWTEVAAVARPGVAPVLEIRLQRRLHDGEPELAGTFGVTPLTVDLPSGSTTVRFGVGLDGRIDLPRLGGTDGTEHHRWDGAGAPGRQLLVDTVGGRHGRVVGGALQLCQGVRHLGRSNDPSVDPEGHSAIHLHSDDLEDARWPTAAEVTIPPAAASGVLAIELRDGDAVERLPVVVRGPGEAPLLVLLPTLTYLAYANEHANPPELPGRCPEVAADFGRANQLGSWYDRHRDGSRWWLLTSRRPLLGIRPEHRFRVLGGEHGLSQDLMLLGWLERRGIRYEVACDHDLHTEGAGLLGKYRAVVTGAHPEYWTAAMLDGLEAYLGGGGRLAYLGGNGFLWTTGVDAERPWLHEVRKAFADNAVVDGETGEDHLQTTLGRAGMWQMVDRRPAALVGVATTAMGFEGAAPYRRTAASHDPRVARIFAGVGDGPIGDHGEILGGAAGYEVDLANPSLGTPPHALVVATANLPDSYGPFAPTPFPSPTGENAASRRRADMVFFETPKGGAVFSVSSILWTDAMRWNGDDNDVSRITENALRWFAEPAI